LNKTTIETLGPDLESLGFEVVYASSKKGFVFRLLDMMGAILFHRKKLSYILIDTYSTKAFWYAFLCAQLARLLKIKYIPILHGGNLPNRFKNNPKLCRMLFAKAFKNVAPSGYLKQAFENEGFTNVVLIPNAIEIGKYEFKNRTNLSPKLLWVRAFATIYNPEMALRVLQQLQKAYPEATLTMVGPEKDGSLQTTKALAASLGLSVTFTGQLSKEAWWQLAAEHDIFINTTHFDNTPVSVLEAMALGLPVVSTAVGGIPYLITPDVTGKLVPDADTDAMVAAITELLQQQEQGQLLIQNARSFVAQMDWDVVKEKWVEVLK
jgi:glycosyltransferase involved in cell wall biosynthesis